MVIIWRDETMREFVKDDKGKPKLFDSLNSAIDFLVNYGFAINQVIDYHFTNVCTKETIYVTFEDINYYRYGSDEKVG